MPKIVNTTKDLFTLFNTNLILYYNPEKPFSVGIGNFTFASYRAYIAGDHQEDHKVAISNACAGGDSVAQVTIENIIEHAYLIPNLSNDRYGNRTFYILIVTPEANFVVDFYATHFIEFLSMGAGIDNNCRFTKAISYADGSRWVPSDYRKLIRKEDIVFTKMADLVIGRRYQNKTDRYTYIGTVDGTLHFLTEQSKAETRYFKLRLDETEKPLASTITVNGTKTVPVWGAYYCTIDLGDFSITHGVRRHESTMEYGSKFYFTMPNGVDFYGLRTGNIMLKVYKDITPIPDIPEDICAKLLQIVTGKSKIKVIDTEYGVDYQII